MPPQIAESEQSDMVDINLQLPNNFFEEEERWGYKITKERKELWAIELDLLCEFDRVCRKLGLRYFIDGGTLLGAVRDRHFIPWDDDIDVVMLREDYDMILKYGPAEFSPPIFLQNAYTDIDYRRGLTQLRRSDTTFVLKREIRKNLPFNQGICIDIFPLDGLPARNQVEQFFEKKQNLRKRISTLVQSPEHDPKEVKQLFRQYEEFCSQYKNTEYLDPVMFHRDIKKIQWYRREFFSEEKILEFEGMTFPAPANYHGVLIQLYGPDYIVPRRVPSEHGDVVWNTQLPYTEVLKKTYLDDLVEK